MRKIIATLLMLLVSSAAVLADDVRSVTNKYSSAALTPEYSQVSVGSSSTLAFTIKPIKNWHTYWLNAGDTANPPLLTWETPDRVTIEGYEMEVPQFIPLAPYASYGYKRPSTILTTLNIPADYDRDTVEIKLLAQWFVCDDICVPERGEFSMTLTIGEDKKEPLADVIIAKSEDLQPKVNDWSSSLNVSESHVRLSINMGNEEKGTIGQVRFFPETKNVIHYIAEQDFSWTETGFSLTTERSTMRQAIGQARGVVKVTYDSGETIGYWVNPTVTFNPMTVMEVSLIQLLLMALAGGLVLNLMPCVFPILSLKAIAFLRASDKPEVHRREQGLFYTLGILVSFALIAMLLIFIRSGGELVGWGFQLQDPRFVAVMAFVILAVGLSLLGLFNISFGVEATGQDLASKDGRKGSFFTGFLATLVATPCTAPFMAPALGFAMTQSNTIIIASMLMVGLGLALPFLLLSFFPSMSRFLPKQGGWMNTVKQGLAFPMFLTVAWLIWVFSNQTGEQDSLMLMGMLVIFAFGIWLYQNTNKKAVKIVSGLIMVSSLFGAITISDGPRDSTLEVMTEFEETYSDERLASLLAEEKPVFVYFTADWCITCKVNETMALFRSDIYDAVAKSEITVLKADWTNKNDHIAEILRQNGRAGVPMYLWYPKGAASKEILPEILTKGRLLEAFEAVE